MCEHGFIFPDQMPRSVTAVVWQVRSSPTLLRGGLPATPPEGQREVWFISILTCMVLSSSILAILTGVCNLSCFYLHLHHC